MPTYEYRCNACRREFEIVQKMSDDDLVTCEVCGEPKLEKLLSRSAFQLKGSGWYKDLYSSNPKEAVRDAVDKGVPPKTEKKADAPASSDSSSSGSASSSDSGSSGSSGSSSSSSGGASSGGSSSGTSGTSTP